MDIFKMFINNGKMKWLLLDMNGKISLKPGAHFNIKTDLPDIGIPNIKMMHSSDQLIFLMGIYSGKTTSLYIKMANCCYMYAYIYELGHHWFK